jgi:hypothetical protein
MRMRMAKMEQYESASFVKHLARFATPNDLAEALSSENATLRQQAIAAWSSDVGPAKTLSG